jgi:hypothetical protein
MTFWSANNVEPTRQYRFTVSDGMGVWWWAKSIDKPSFDIDSQEHKLINHKFKYPGVATWNDIKISIVDVGEKVDDLNTQLGYSGYDPTGGLFVEGINKKDASEAFRISGELSIHQLDSQGKVLEEWTLVNPWIKTLSFGSLDYSSDDLVALDITVTYDWAKLT